MKPFSQLHRDSGKPFNKVSKPPFNGGLLTSTEGVFMYWKKSFEDLFSPTEIYSNQAAKPEDREVEKDMAGMSLQHCMDDGYSASRNGDSVMVSLLVSSLCEGPDQRVTREYLSTIGDHTAATLVKSKVLKRRVWLLVSHRTKSFNPGCRTGSLRS